MQKRLSSIIIILALVLFLFQSGLVKAEGRVIVDMVGRTVELPEKVERVVTTYKSATEFVLALGACDRLVGLPLGGNEDPLYLSLREGEEKLAEVGSKRKGLNLEQIIALQPDLVVLFPYKDGPEVAKKLEQQGIASIIIMPESFEQIRETNMLLGKALGLEEKARKVEEEFDRIMEFVSRTSEISEEEKEVVYFANRQFLNTVGEGMLQTNVIELAGGINPAKDVKGGFIETSPEQIINWDPGVIVVSQFFQEDLGKFKKNPVYQLIKAFRDDAIYRCPSNIQSWDFPGPSSYLMILWLSQKMYPELYNDVNFLDIVNEFYFNLYGKSFTEMGGEL